MAARVAFSSAFVGSLVGWFGNNYYESWKVNEGTCERLSLFKEPVSEHLTRKPGLPIFGTVSAATPFENKSGLVPAPPNAAVNMKRIDQIMKHGYPRMNKLKSFQDFVLAYDCRTRVAYWVFEHINKENTKYNPEVDRQLCEFFPDEDIHPYFRSTNEDYLKSGYDRGHLAAAGNHKSNQKLCAETFALSNIAPQVGRGFNRDYWNSLEKYVRKLVKTYKNVYVCTGPLYLPRKWGDGYNYVHYRVIGANQVAVPTHFFKIIIGETENDELHLESYVLPNEKIDSDVPLAKFLTQIESIEMASGLLFFNENAKQRITMKNKQKTK